MTDDIVHEWISNLEAQSPSSIDVIGEDAAFNLVAGHTSETFRAKHCFFIDGNGKVNVSVSYWFSADDGSLVRGWWDVTPSDDALNAAKKSSSLWDLLPQS
jgi:hypothetical protein